MKTITSSIINRGNKVISNPVIENRSSGIKPYEQGVLHDKERQEEVKEIQKVTVGVKNNEYTSTIYLKKVKEVVIKKGVQVNRV